MTLPPRVVVKKERVLLYLTIVAFLWSSTGTHKVLASSPWVERDDALVDVDWLTLRSSASGSKLVGIVINNNDSLRHVEYSSDGGGTWTDITPNDPDVADEDELDPGSVSAHAWSDVDISSDGNILALSDNNPSSEHNYIWYSPNHGTYWTKLNGDNQPGPGYWSSVSVANGGQYIAASSEIAENIAISTDYGSNWEMNAEPIAAPWTHISFSPDGDTLAAIHSGGGYVFISENQGVSWLEVDSPQYSWTKVSAADGGSVLVGGGLGVPIYLRKDLGDGFVWLDANFGVSGYVNVEISGDGEHFIASEEPGYIYIAGETPWEAQDFPGDPGIQSWASLAVNQDGSKIFAAGNDTEVWAYDASLVDVTPPTVTSVSPIGGSINNGSPIDTPIVIQFSEPVYSDTLTISTNSCESDCPTYDQSWSDDDSQVTLTRNDAAFQYATEYTLSVSVSDLRGNEMPEPYVWNFTTNRQASSHHSSQGTSLQTRIKNLEEMGNAEAVQRLKQESLAAATLPGIVRVVNPVPPVSDIQKIEKDMSFGMTGENITTLQNFLIQQNKGAASLALKTHGVSDYFGRLTQAALIEWQKAYNIFPATGNFGPKTRAKIKELGL